MNKGILGLIIAGGVLLTVGGVVLAVALANNAFNKQKYVTNEYVIEDAFSDISIDNAVADIKFEASSDGQTKVVCIDKEKLYHEASVVNGALTVTQIDKLTGFDKMFGYNGNLKVTVYLPEGTYGDLSIKSTTGHIYLNNEYTFKAVNLETSTGDIYLEKVAASEDVKIKTSTGDRSIKGMTCKDMVMESSTGDQHYENVNCQNITIKASTGKLTFVEFIAEKHFESNGDTGKVSFRNSDAETLKIKTSTGNVVGNLLTNKIFRVKTSTGKVTLPEERTGGLCEIETSTGDINISIGRID